MRWTWMLLSMLWLCGTAGAQSITLSPAVVPLGGQPGQGVTQTLTLRNDSPQALEFALEAQDVQVRDGVRAFARAGELPGGIAASAVFSAPRVRVEAGASASASVTLTLPAAPSVRAVVVFFRATRAVAAGEHEALMSLGTLFTFELSDRRSVRTEPLQLTPPGDSNDLQVRVPLLNDGTEPVRPGGAIALLDAGGRLVGKLELPAKRLLPGERGTLSADYAGELAPGAYRVVATLDVAGRPLTLDAPLQVP